MESLHPIAEVIISVLLVTGGFFTLVGALGLVRLSDFYSRLHGPTKATTVGVGSIVGASMIYFSMKDWKLAIAEILIMLFLFLTAPISANILAKAAMHLRVRRSENTRGQPWDQ
ncbi:multisubunit potassium/proton antiporter, PhaG subunit [Marinobacter daqiaonensis]|uniref:Multisubunit potassium/proton antiporter, PhaG subunit n=1 Tax=Marinobacter daqiaonensis TaxID=650891 RepID=A0A1I6HL27_9GAMM|nr:Na+/H+ antiporter subunit G [Marinobacter daqiaonensis]SFR55171.1 multisubunit potassium/proton antiporter, PhaG subunit [Marinobacter daqiaonensis]